ncbi:unnamed protein product [Prunus armeniaca]
MHFPGICEHIMDISSFHDPAAGDLLLWAPSSSGGFSAKDAYEFTRPKFVEASTHGSVASYARNYCVAIIWDLRNKLQFEEKVSTVSSTCCTIINHVCASSPLARGHMLTKVRDMCIIRSIGVHYHPRPNSKIVEVAWHTPCFGFVKIKIDGAHKRDSGKAGSGGVFRNYQGHVLGAFSANLDVPNAVHTEVLAVIKAIELAWLHAWHNIWIETDSLLVTKFFRSPHLVPWRLQVDCHAVDGLANHGALGFGLTWWDTAPSFIFTFLSAGLAGHA